MFGKKINSTVLWLWFCSGSVLAANYTNPFVDQRCQRQSLRHEGQEIWLKWPIEQIRLVGVVTKGSRKLAWIQSQLNEVQTVEVGDYLGIEPLQITAIGEEGLSYQGQGACQSQNIRGRLEWHIAQGRSA